MKSGLMAACLLAIASMKAAPSHAAQSGTELPPAAQMQVQFNQHVQPILAENCFGCHGARQQQSGLRLDKRQNALRGGDYGPVIVPGNSAESKLIRRVVNGDGGLQMPPSGALSADDIGVLRAWIDQGAEFAEIEIKGDEGDAKPIDPKLRQLISAVRAQNARTVEELLASNPDLVKGQDSGRSTPLHHAAGFGTVATMKLLLDRGADANAKNATGSTPLHWAVTNVEKAQLLLERGAAINGRAGDGRTALYMAASQRNSDAVLRLLLARGADPNLALLNGRTPLMAAAAGGDATMIQLLIDKKADVRAASGTGSVALMDATLSRNAEAVKLLLEAGADVSVQTKRKQTALGQAAMQGSEAIVKMLLERGAQVNTQDDRGYSPLMFAAYSEAMPAGIVRLLLEKGARTDVTGEGETPRSLAAKRGDTEVARLLGVPEADRLRGGTADAPRPSEKPSIPDAVQRATFLLEKQSPQFVRIGGCNSCHSQSIPSAALSLARERGIPAPKALTELPPAMVERTAERAMDFNVISVNSIGYEMFGYAAIGRPADEYSDAIVHYLKAMQMPQGYWHTTNNRPPLTFDHFVTTAMAINAIRVYSPASQKADSAARLARAAAWLEAAQPVSTQERAFQLLGLMWAKGNSAVIERAARGLAQTQRHDGGWSQLPTMGSDAYATGEALYALHLAGKMPTNNAVYQKGVQYLLRTQAQDGSWHVKTRSLPFQPYFQSGFPYDHDQWISAAGTGWAAMALSLTVERPRTSSR